MAPGRRAATILVVGGVPAIIIFIFRLLQAIKTSRKRKELEDRADKRRSKATQQIDEVVAQAQDGSDGESSGGFTCIPYKELKLQIEKGKLGVYDVVCAYRRKAATLHKELNCLTGFIDEALEHAKNLDSLRESGQLKGVLHGIPVSVKETILIQGYDSTAGIAKRCGVLSDEDSVAIAAIKEAGGIPFCRTNIPQTNLSYGCSNPIFGATCNPFKKDRTSGGSSGGEAALISCGGSVLGMGTDIGGSIRVPAAFCGICGFKPFSGRISRRGSFSVLPGQTGVAASFGPMAKEVDTVAAAMSALVTHTSKYDSFVAPIPWNWDTYNSNSKLRIGYYVADGFIASTPPCARAVREACEAMRARGHQIVPFAAPRAIKCLLLFIKLLTADGGESVFELLQDEKVDGSLRAFVEGVRVSGSFWAGKLLPKALRRQGKKRVADLLESQGICSTAELWKAQSERLRLQLIWERAFKEAGIDVLICPSHTMLAPKPHVVASSGITLCYTQIFNFLDFPAGTVPVGTANSDDEIAMEDWPYNTLKEQFGDELERMIESNLVYGEQHDAVEAIVRSNCQGISGLPTAVQCVTLPWNEELCLRAMREIQSALGKNVPTPCL